MFNKQVEKSTERRAVCFCFIPFPSIGYVLMLCVCVFLLLFFVPLAVPLWSHGQIDPSADRPIVSLSYWQFHPLSFHVSVISSARLTQL